MSPSCPLSSPLLRKWATCPPLFYLQTSRPRWSFRAPSMCFIFSFQVFAFIAYKATRRKPSKGPLWKGSTRVSQYCLLLSGTCFFLLFPHGRDNSDRKRWWKLGPVVYRRNSHGFSHLCTHARVQCGLADPLIQRWPLFLHLLHLGFPCDPGAWPQHRLENTHTRTRCLAALGTLRPPHEWAWASLLNDERYARGKVIPIVRSQFWDMWMRPS